jgi:arylsulfatase A-like enzyme
VNILMLVVDSLRFDAVGPTATPFLHRLHSEATWFRRAYATECWTLPSHASMFTGLLASQHRAHFQTMGYEESHPTIAELCRQAGYQTETRIFMYHCGSAILGAPPPSSMMWSAPAISLG